MNDTDFYIPNKGVFTSEQTIKKSRFIATISQVETKNEALKVIDSVKVKFNDARHNCWAYLIGAPNSPRAVACNDAGEPKGTAGRPILNVIQFKNISQVVIVVTRYYGGIKLGASGLIRAYSGSAKLAIDNIKLIKFVTKVNIKICTTYSYVNSILNILSQNNLTLLNSKYAENIILSVEINEQDKYRIIKLISEVSKGTALINII